MKKKILIVSPKFPYPTNGACELDRATGIELLVKLGHEVQVVTKVYDEERGRAAQAVGERLGFVVVPVPYKYLHPVSSAQKVWYAVKRIIRTWYLDGAAFEYSEPEIQTKLQQTLNSFQPDSVWFDYTYLWPLYHMVRARRIPIVTRSINFEPTHFLEEDGRSFVNYLKFLPKVLSEYTVVRGSDFIFAITPKEAGIYKKLGARNVAVLPLRGLTNCLLDPVPVKESSTLNVFFSGSTYNVVHNRKALEFILTQIIPETQKQFPGQFRFHIFGGKVPPSFDTYFGVDVIKHGFLASEEFGRLMHTMDIAIAPSLYGAGMQQKIFEPLARGLPTVTSPRGLAGYPFKDQEHLLLANSYADFVRSLGLLRDITLRRKLSDNAHQLAATLFSESVIVGKITSALHSVIKPVSDI